MIQQRVRRFATETSLAGAEKRIFHQAGSFQRPASAMKQRPEAQRPSNRGRAVV
jgi:hypothetical protein